MFATIIFGYQTFRNALRDTVVAKPMDKIKWSEKVSNEEVLRRVGIDKRLIRGFTDYQETAEEVDGPHFKT